MEVDPSKPLSELDLNTLDYIEDFSISEDKIDLSNILWINETSDLSITKVRSDEGGAFLLSLTKPNASFILQTTQYVTVSELLDNDIFIFAWSRSYLLSKIGTRAEFMRAVVVDPIKKLRSFEWP